MISVSTIEQLKAMKFSAMAKAFQEQINDPTTFSALGFEERFGLMVDAEWNKRQDNKRLRYVRDAHLDIPTACMQDGHSPYENGDGVYGDNCYPMDFIGTMRFWDSMYREWLEDPEGFIAEHCPDTASSEELHPEGWMNPSTDE